MSYFSGHVFRCPRRRPVVLRLSMVKTYIVSSCFFAHAERRLINILEARVVTISDHRLDPFSPQTDFFFLHHRVQDEVRLHNQRACDSRTRPVLGNWSVNRSETHRPTSTPVLSAAVGSNPSLNAAGHTAIAAQNFSLGCTVVAPRSAKEAAPC